MLMTLLLVGFAPIAGCFTIHRIGRLDGSAAFGILVDCDLFGVRFLAHGFSHSHARSRAGLVTWVVIFVLVAVQMTTALRPLVGTGDSFLPTSKKFFLTHWAESLRQRPEPAPR